MRNIYCFQSYYECILTCFTTCFSFCISSHLHKNNDKNSEILYEVDPLKWLDTNAFSINMLMLFLILYYFFSDGNHFLWFCMYLRLVARISHPIVLQLSESCLLFNFFIVCLSFFFYILKYIHLTLAINTAECVEKNHNLTTNAHNHHKSLLFVAQIITIMRLSSCARAKKTTPFSSLQTNTPFEGYADFALCMYAFLYTQI